MTDASLKHEERIAILAKRLSETFGDAASDLIERQIQDAEGDARTTWSAIRQFLSQVKDRPLQSQ
jgi:hypothetical protein